MMRAQVDSAELENVATGEKWIFDFKCWLDHKNGMSATRPPSRFKAATKGKPCNYRQGKQRCWVA